MDAGQSIELWAVGINVQLLVPTGTVEVLADGTFIGLDGTVFDSATSAAVMPLGLTRGKKECQFTQWHHVPAGQRPLLEIPAFARRVQIRQTGAGNASAAWTAEVTGVLVASQSFTIPFVGRQTARVLLGYATHLRPDLDPATARDFEVTYIMEP